MTSGADQAYAELVQHCMQIVDGIEGISNSYLSHYPAASLPPTPFQQARVRLNSQLLTVAVCGAFSSGKSFLINAVVDRLKWQALPQANALFPNLVQDTYTEFIPTFPVQTNSCPLYIVPAQPGEATRLEVRFDGQEVWEPKSKPTDDEHYVRTLLLGYCTSIDEYRKMRLDGDMHRAVSVARLVLGNAPIPAVFYDLPGVGGEKDRYVEIVNQALHEADCIIYVTSALKELTESELQLLGRVARISDDTGARVFFVLSQTDRERDWVRVLNKNNEFLQKYFNTEAGSNKAFVGARFSGVSPALEAQVAARRRDSSLSEDQATARFAASGMVAFRQELSEYLSSTSGPAHMRTIGETLIKYLRLMRISIREQLASQRVPLDEVAARLQECRVSAKQLMEGRRSVLDSVDAIGDNISIALKVALDENELAYLFASELSEVIEREDVTKEHMIHLIEDKASAITKTWLQRPKAGLHDSWKAAVDSYWQQVVPVLHEWWQGATVGDRPKADDFLATIEVISQRRLGPAQRTGDGAGLIQNAVGIGVGVAGLGAGGLAAAGLAAGVALVLGPVFAALALSAVAAKGLQVVQRRAERKRQRQFLRDRLPEHAREVVERCRAEVRHELDRLRLQVTQVMAQVISLQEQNVAALEHRLASGELKRIGRSVERLEELEEQGAEVDRRLAGFLESCVAVAGTHMRAG